MLARYNPNQFNTCDKLSVEIKEFCITKTNLQEQYWISDSPTPNYLTVGVEYEFKATVSYELWLKLKPYTETKNVSLIDCIIKKDFKCIEVTFTLKGFGLKAPYCFYFIHKSTSNLYYLK